MYLYPWIVVYISVCAFVMVYVPDMPACFAHNICVRVCLGACMGAGNVT